jgi:hypothetical protein
MLPFFTNIGSYIKSSVNAFNNAATAAVHGTAVQLEGVGYAYKSAQFGLYLGAATGTPSTISVVAQIEQSADGSTNWTSYNDLPGNGTLTLTAASTQATMNVILQGAQQYVRITVTPSFTGGSSPAIPVIATLVIGGTSEHPAV